MCRITYVPFFIFLSLAGILTTVFLIMDKRIKTMMSHPIRICHIFCSLSDISPAIKVSIILFAFRNSLRF